MSGDGFCPSLERDGPLEVPRSILLIWYVPAIAIQVAPRRSPTGCVDGGYDAMHAVRSEEAVIDARAQAVLVQIGLPK